MEALSKMMISANPSPLLSGQTLQKLKQEMLQMSYFVFNKDTRLNAVYLIDENNNAFIFDGEKTYPTRAVLNSKILSRYLTLLSFPEDRSNNSTLNVFSSSLSPLPPSGGTAQKYIAQRAADRKQVIDIFNLESCTAAVFNDYASLNDWPQVLINTWTPAKVFCGSEGKNLNNKSVYITDTEGRSHEFFLENNKVVVKDLAADPFAGIKVLADLRKQTLVLHDNGSLYVKNSEGAWQLHEGFRNRKFKLMTRPFLWTPLVYEGPAL
jgi:hypothetical protein